MKTLPETIEITFTEEDRQKAERFCENCSCLVSTALKRMGYTRVSESVHHVSVDGGSYAHAEFGPDEACFDYTRDTKPFYAESVVGTTLTLTKHHTPTL